MPKHLAPTPTLFSRPGTYLLAAIVVTGAMVGAIPLSTTGTTLLALAVGVPLALLTTIPAPGESRRPVARRVARVHIPAAVYIANAAALFAVLFTTPRPLESEARTGSRPLESEAAGYRPMTECWCGCGGGMLVAELVAESGGRMLVAEADV